MSKYRVFSGLYFPVFGLNTNQKNLCIWTRSHSVNLLTYPFILSNIKINGLITLSKYQIKYLQLVFVPINFELTILSILTSQIFIVFFAT